MEDEMIFEEEFEEDEQPVADFEQKMRIEAIVRLIVNIVLLINWILTLTGRNPLPFGEETLYAWLSGIISSVGLLWGCWWKNNNITENACKAQGYKDELDLGQIGYHEEPDMGDWDDEEEPEAEEVPDEE